MILSKDKQGNWTPTAGGTGTFIGTKATFDAVKATLPDNTAAYVAYNASIGDFWIKSLFSTQNVQVKVLCYCEIY